MLVVLSFLSAAWPNHPSLQTVVKAESWGAEGAPELDKTRLVAPLLSCLVLQEWGLAEINTQYIWSK